MYIHFLSTLKTFLAQNHRRPPFLDHLTVRPNVYMQKTAQYWRRNVRMYVVLNSSKRKKGKEFSKNNKRKRYKSKFRARLLERECKNARCAKQLKELIRERYIKAI